ncbi:hypothetical protein HELRODRAFT_169044 [Helobdella robusta]|uniref:Uncharacterized protein n=1 Tax=Helobdella robusta TaxID=6412 RepID=T1F1B1_HELRO|nr:hypothetical protein HELRODRAFT_169044 [Helobdella robusta]ESO09104.1 hypothetical protein HELRODRAFT_169044 [Helobdella robusta]
MIASHISHVSTGSQVASEQIEQRRLKYVIRDTKKKFCEKKLFLTRCMHINYGEKQEIMEDLIVQASEPKVTNDWLPALDRSQIAMNETPFENLDHSFQFANFLLI